MTPYGLLLKCKNSCNWCVTSFFNLLFHEDKVLYFFMCTMCHFFSSLFIHFYFSIPSMFSFVLYLLTMAARCSHGAVLCSETTADEEQYGVFMY